MSEGLEKLQEPEAEETLPELAVDSASEPAQPREQATSERPVARQFTPWLRLAYSFEFLLAVLVIFTVWSEVGGQGHLDLMPWYTKLACVLVSAWCCVRLTAGVVEEPKTWNRRSVLWLTGLILAATTMAVITYYYHLHEEMDEPDSVQTATVMTWNLPAPFKAMRND